MLLSGEGVRDQIAAAERPRRVVDATTLRGVHDLNRQFLGGVLPALQERPTAIAAVAALTPAARSLAAECPYSLYDFRFADADLWRSIAADSRPALAPPGPAAAFCRAAAFLTWHLVRSSELAAPLTLGMVPAVVDLWRTIPLSLLDHVAATAAPFLAPRWAGHPTFWSLLVDGAVSGNLEQLAGVRLLGLQLLATDSLPARLAPVAAVR